MRNRFAVAAALCFGLAAGVFAETRTFYLKPGGNDKSDGTSWETAWGSWDKAWTKITSGTISGTELVGKSIELVVRAGTYTSGAVGFGAVDNTPVYVHSETGARDVIVDGQGQNCMLRLSANNAAMSVMISGFVFTNGTTTTKDSAPGAVRVGSDTSESYGSIIVSNCTFVCNRTAHEGSPGGAVRMSGNNTLITHCLFKENATAAGTRARGPAVMVHLGTGNRISHCEFIDNWCATNAGAVVQLNENATRLAIDNSLFRGNHGGARGGALYLSHSKSWLCVTNCVFDSNYTDIENGTSDNFTAGAGIYQHNGNTILSGCVFTNNWTAWRAPAFYLRTGTLSITDTLCISNRAADSAGVLFIEGGSFAATNFTAVGNTSGNNGGVISMGSSTSAPVTLSGCRFIDNAAKTGGGGFLNPTTGRVLVTNCLFRGNTAQFGGGMSVTGLDTTVVDCEFVENATRAMSNDSYHGGGISNGGSTNPSAVGTRQTGVIVRNCLFTGNRAHTGGGFYNSQYNTYTIDTCVFSNNAAICQGGGIYVKDSIALSEDKSSMRLEKPSRIRGCLFACNSAIQPTKGTAQGGGLYIYGALPAYATYPRLVESCTVVSNVVYTPEGSPLAPGMYLGAPDVAWCVVSNTVLAYNAKSLTGTLSYRINVKDTEPTTLYGCCSHPAHNEGKASEVFSPARGCLNVATSQGASLFVDRAAGDWRLASGSPCRKAGLPADWMADATDLDGTPRLAYNGARAFVDIGAFQYKVPFGTVMLIR